MVITNPFDDDRDMWLTRQFTWNPNDFGGDIEATIDAWYLDVRDRFKSRTDMNLEDMLHTNGLGMRGGPKEYVKEAMRYRINNEHKPLSGVKKKSITDGKYTGFGSRVFDNLVSNHSEGLRPGEYYRPLISAADGELKEQFIKQANTLINNTPVFKSKHPVTGVEIDPDKFLLRFGITYPQGFIAPIFERHIETTEETEGTDMNTIPLEIVVEFAVLSAIIDRQGSKMNPNQVFQYLGNLDGSLKGQVIKLASPLMFDLGYGRDLEPVANLDEIQSQLDALVAEYSIVHGGSVTTTETIIEENVPVMKFEIRDLQHPENNTVELIRLEDFFYTHRTNEIIHDQISRILPPVPELSPDIYPNIGGTSANGWRQIGGRSGTYIIKFSRDPVDVLCISTGRGGSVPDQPSHISQENGIQAYNYQLEVEEDGQAVVRSFRAPGWRSCQGLSNPSMTASYAAGPYQAIAYGECAIYVFPNDPNGWDRTKPMARLFLRWGYKNWMHPNGYESDSAKLSLKKFHNGATPYSNYYSNDTDSFNIGEKNEPVILWEPRPYPTDGLDNEWLKAFFYSAWDICQESGSPSHHNFEIAGTPYIVSGYSDITGAQNIHPTYGGGVMPHFSLDHSGAGANLEELGGAGLDFSMYRDPLLSEEVAMSASADITARPELFEALATNASVWLYPSVLQNMRRYAAGQPALQMMSSSNFALPKWLRNTVNSTATGLDLFFDRPWLSNNLLNTLTSNPQIFFDPTHGTYFDEAEKVIGSPGMQMSMHGYRYKYTNQEEDPEIIRQVFSDDGWRETTLDIGTAFELFYLGVLHPSNKINPNAPECTPFISCLPAGDLRISRGSPELRDLPIGVEAVADDFLSGKITKRLNKTLKGRALLRRRLDYGGSHPITSQGRPSEELYETMLVWRNIISSPFLSQEKFEAMLEWYSEKREMEKGDANSELIMVLNGEIVLQLWQYPFISNESRGFKMPTTGVEQLSKYQASHASWHTYGWQERQTAAFTNWAVLWFSNHLGLDNYSFSTLESYLKQPLLNDAFVEEIFGMSWTPNVTFAPFMIRNQESFDALYSIMFTPRFEELVGAENAPIYRFCLLFSPISNTNINEPLLKGISDVEGGYLSLSQYQNLLTEALEGDGKIMQLISTFQYDFLPLASTNKRFRTNVPDEIQAQLLKEGVGEQVGYNLISSFLRGPERIRQYANDMMKLALGSLWPQYAETSELPTPSNVAALNGEPPSRMFKRENNIRFKVLVTAAIGGSNSMGGLARNPNMPEDVAELIYNTWFNLTQSWNDYSYARNMSDINTALSENVGTPGSILTSIYEQEITLQEKIAKNPNCSFEILSDIFGLNADGAWADDANPIVALSNPGLSSGDYQIFYDMIMTQLTRDARSMDEKALDIPPCFQLLEGITNQFYEYQEGAERTNQITSILSSNPNLRYWRGGSDKGSFSGNISGDSGWIGLRWPGVDTDESCARTWSLTPTSKGRGTGLEMAEDSKGKNRVGKLMPGEELAEKGLLNSPFVLIKYNTPRASGRGDGNQTTCPEYGDKPIIGDSTFGQVIFVQRIYKRMVGRGELRQNEDGTWVGRRYVWTFDGYWYDEEGNKQNGSEYQVEDLDEFFGWLGFERYNRIGFGEGGQGLKWAQGVVVCITDEMTLGMAEEGLDAFKLYFGDAADTDIEPVPLWRANWTRQDSLNLLRTLINKNWALTLDNHFGMLTIGSIRNELRTSPLRIYKPGAEAGTEPVLDVSTLMIALDQPIEGDNDSYKWTPEVVEYFAWDILQGGYDAFKKLNNIPKAFFNEDGEFSTPSIFLPLLMSPNIVEAWHSEDVAQRDYAIRSDQSNPTNVLNLLLSEFGTTRQYLEETGVWGDAFEGTLFDQGRRQRQNMIGYLLTNENYVKNIPIELLTSIYTVHTVDSQYIGDSNINNTTTLRTSRIDEFHDAYATQRKLIIELLSNYTTYGSEYALGQISVGGVESVEEIFSELPINFPCFSNEMFLLATTDSRRFDGDIRQWPGYLSSNRDAYVNRLMDNRDSMVGMLTKDELKDIIIQVNYNCEFANRIIIPSFTETVDYFVDNNWDPIEAEAAAVSTLRSQLDSLIGEGQSDKLLNKIDSDFAGIDYSFIGALGQEDSILDMNLLIDETITSGDIRTE